MIKNLFTRVLKRVFANTSRRGGDNSASIARMVGSVPTYFGTGPDVSPI